MNKIIDARGKNCPIPIIMAKNEIDGGNKHFVVKVDNKITVKNLQKLANSKNFETSIQEGNGIFKVQFSKDFDKENEIDACEEYNEILTKLEEDKKNLGT